MFVFIFRMNIKQQIFLPQKHTEVYISVINRIQFILNQLPLNIKEINHHRKEICRHFEEIKMSLTKHCEKQNEDQLKGKNIIVTNAIIETARSSRIRRFSAFLEHEIEKVEAVSYPRRNSIPRKKIGRYSSLKYVQQWEDLLDKHNIGGDEINNNDSADEDVISEEIKPVLLPKRLQQFDPKKRKKRVSSTVEDFLEVIPIHLSTPLSPISSEFGDDQNDCEEVDSKPPICDYETTSLSVKKEDICSDDIPETSLEKNNKKDKTEHHNEADNEKEVHSEEHLLEKQGKPAIVIKLSLAKYEPLKDTKSDSNSDSKSTLGIQNPVKSVLESELLENNVRLSTEIESNETECSVLKVEEKIVSASVENHLGKTYY